MLMFAASAVCCMFAAVSGQTFAECLSEKGPSFDAAKRVASPRPAPRLLLTHAVGDKVVPVESERNFVAAYRAAGNIAEVFEYPCDIRGGLTGHCTWIPDSAPHRLIPEIEARITDFLKGENKNENDNGQHAE